MTPRELLGMLHDAGVDAEADLNDGLAPGCGWFGWELDRDILTVHYESASDPSKDQSARWRIVPWGGGG